MSVLTHGPNCKTRLFQTVCRDCDEEVFYFSCNCGSKVFFNSREYPWPKHGDTCLPYLVRLNIEEGFRTIEEIREVVEEHARDLGVSVPERVYRLLRQDDVRRANRLQPQRVLPSDNQPPIVASVVSITPKINLLNVFKLEDNVIGRGFLGRFANQEFAQIIIREEANEENICREFNVYLERSNISQLALRQNTSVFVTLSSFGIPGRDLIWIVQKIERG